MNDNFMICYCDGSSNPHTKRSGIGAVWFNKEHMINPEDGETLQTTAVPILTLSKEIFSGNSNKHPTNNEAEYISLIKALELSIEKGIQRINFFMDSKLVVEQVNNRWKINFKHLQELKNKVDIYKSQIEFKLKHVKRKFNHHADKESKDCLNSKSNYFNEWKQ